MKIIVSSKAFAQALSKIDFDADCVTDASCENGVLSLTTHNNKNVRIEIHITEVAQANRVYTNKTICKDTRWDWISSLMNQVNEQPVVFEFLPKVTNVIFQY